MTINRKYLAIFAVLSSLFAGVASAAVPTEVTDVFTSLGTDVGTLMAAAAILFGLIRGGTAIFKIASRFFGAAGA